MLQFHVVFGDAKKSGYKGDEMFVGFSSHRGGGEPDLDVIADYPGHSIAAGAWLDLYLKNEIRTVPSEPAHVSAAGG